MILKECSEKRIRREVFEFEEDFGDWKADRWTRLTVNGELEIPHDEYGEMASPTRADKSVEKSLEKRYQKYDS